MAIRLILLNLVLVLCSSLAPAEVTQASIDELLKAHYGDHKIKVESLLLTDEQAKSLKEESAIDLNSRLFRYFVISDRKSLKGIAIIDTHKIRTKSESLLFLFDEKAKLEAIEILVFHEPVKYKPGQEQLEAVLKLQQDKTKKIPMKTGATLTSYALERSRRRAFALLSIIREKL